MSLAELDEAIAARGAVVQTALQRAAPTAHLDPASAIQRARELLSPRLAERDAPAYPVAALGPLSDVCTAVAEHGQVEPAMAGQCLLGAASLLTQGLHNVETLAGVRPLSLYLQTLGDSGDGKTTAQGIALRPVIEAQRQLAADYRAELEDWRAKPKGKDKGEPPSPPAYRLCADSTVEGLRRDLDNGIVSQGMFSDEAAAILAGYGMSADMRSKTAAFLSKLFDAGHLSASRVTTGRTERYGVRMALHWLLQPMAAAETMTDPMLSALGFWPRFLLAWPSPQQPRLHRPFRPETLPSVGAYWQRCSELLAAPLPEDATDSPTLVLAPAARLLLGRAFERFEVQARKGDLRGIKPFALRAVEQACRVAGVLTAFAGEVEVSEASARNALALVGYSLDSWQAIIEGGAADPSAANALRLYEWLFGRTGASERLAVIVKDGPAQTRTKDKRDAALDLLEAHGLVLRIEGGSVKAVAPCGAAYWTAAGFATRWEAENAGCYAHNAAQFHAGARVAP